MQKVDIISINRDIINKIISKYEKIESVIEEKNTLEKFLDKNCEKDNRILSAIKNNIATCAEDIKSIKKKEELNFYLNDTIELISEYKKILKIPIKINFMGIVEKNDKEVRKKEIINKYLKMVSCYIKDLDIKIDTYRDNSCENCKGNNFESIDEVISVCTDCYTERKILKHISSYKDIDRVNICSKYTYNRKIHFRDCINQYQGKQNSSIPTEVYTKLNKEFENHFLLVDSEDKLIKYKKINKGIIMIFLKELNFSKHYENINLIYYNITGNKPDDISHLEEKLMYDFDKLTALYDKLFTKKINRNNFINTQYVLYQLLKRHKHPCKKGDFSVLKTIDRISFHDDICKVLFQKLGWNHYSYF